MDEAPRHIAPRHILVLTDRDWTHPQGGGTGTNLFGQVSRWLAWGHRVTVVAGSYPGAAAMEELAPGLTVHRMGTRLTVFPRAMRAVRRGLAADADVVLEVINGIAFFTPLWLRKPRVALVHHVHKDHYVTELGFKGRIAALLLETIPLRFLYRGTTFLTISQAAKRDLVADGVPEERIHVAYLGVEGSQFRPGRRTDDPRLLYLGRLKQYKRIEVLLDVLEAVPDASLDVAGDGDHREALETEIARRGLGERVRMHGFVDEEQKADLYAEAWVSLTASSAEGWCLTVMEAAACGTPSAALRVGGLPESILDGETGVLADEPAELVERVHRLVEQPEERDRLGAAAETRARTFTWERTAAVNLAVLDAEAEVTPEPITALVKRAGRSDTAKAAGLAAAALGSNAIALAFTLVFTRILGASQYGSLGTLLNYFLVLGVLGQAMQVAAARETTLGRLGAHAALSATVTRWGRDLALACVGLGIVAAIFRQPLADLTGVRETWAAAAVLPTGGFWLLLSIERGVLQGLRAYKLVGLSIVFEALGRLVTGLVLVLPGLGVTGAFLGTPLSMLITAVILFVGLRRRLGAPAPDGRPHRLLGLFGGNWAPVVALGLVALLQTVDTLVIKHQIGGARAGAYIAAGVAAKAVIWVAIGVGLYLLPEATRLAAAGEDPRPALRKALTMVVLVVTPALLIFVAAPKLLLRVAFGHPEYVQASGALVVLGVAFTLLAVAYLSVQYLLALGRVIFLPMLALVVIAEFFALLSVRSLVGYATTVLVMQCLAAVSVLVLALRRLPERIPAAGLPA